MATTGQTTMDSNVWVTGSLGANVLQPSAATVGDTQVIAFPGSGKCIQATKLQQQRDGNYAQGSTVAATSDQHLLAVVNGIAGAVVSFKAGAVTVITGNDTVTVDLLVGGVSILSSPITLNNTQSNYQVVAALLAANALVAGNVLEAKFTYTHLTGTAPKGVFCQVLFTEDPQ
jgi:hypothetical protein